MYFGFERGASEVAEGYFVRKTAKFLKTAKKIPFHKHLRGNNLGWQIWAFFANFHMLNKNYLELLLAALLYFVLELQNIEFWSPWYLVNLVLIFKRDMKLMAS